MNIRTLNLCETNIGVECYRVILSSTADDKKYELVKIDRRSLRIIENLNWFESINIRYILLIFNLTVAPERFHLRFTN